MRAASLFLSLVVFVFAPLLAAAQEPSQARGALEKVVNEILEDIKNPAYADAATRGPIRQKIEREVRSIFDFGEFSSRTVGPRWKTFTPEERQRFSDAFADLLFNTYLNKIGGYNGEQIAYTGEEVASDGKRVEVKTVITLKNGNKTPVSYRMLPKDGSWRVYDVIIENISLVKNYRTQFQDILNTATPEQLIGRIEAKAREIAAQGSGNEK